VLKKTQRSQISKEQVLKTYRERASLRGIERIFGVARQTVMKWIATWVAQLPKLIDTLLPARAGDVLEVDEMWSFVARKLDKRWIWTVICRRTRQIIAFVIGDRSEATCRRLWEAIPSAYRGCRSFSDFWRAYANVFPTHTHQQVGKETGETAHMERWYNTVRQRLARFTRKTLAFSKNDLNHELITRWFIIEYNLEILRSSLTI